MWDVLPTTGIDDQPYVAVVASDATQEHEGRGAIPDGPLGSPPYVYPTHLPNNAKIKAEVSLSNREDQVTVDLVITGATLHTLLARGAPATAVAVADGTIAAVGDDADILALAGPGTRRVDGRGLTVTPGLVDSHSHPFWGAEMTAGIDLTGVRDLSGLRETLVAGCRDLPPDGWVQGWGLTYGVFADVGISGGVFADAIAGRPAHLQFFDCHTGLASPRALAIAGVTGPVEFPVASTIVCDADGPTGELREPPAMDLVRRRIPELSDDARYAIHVGGLRALNAAGLTAVHGMDGDAETYALLARLEDRGDLTVRMVTPLWQKPESTDAEMRADLALRDAGGRRWRGGAAKFFIDGVVETGTAWLVAPDSAGEGLLPYWPDPDRYAAAVKLFADAGFQCITHAVGDRAVRAALDAYATSGRPSRGRHRVEHIELLDPADLPRFAALGVAASMQPLHMSEIRPSAGDPYTDRVGLGRVRGAFPTRDLKRSGAIVALGSDWPVAPFDPRLGMAYALLRRGPGAPDREPVGPGQALTRTEVLEGYTVEPARMVGEEAVAGRIAPGYRADLTVFGADPLTVDPDELLALPITMTIVDGEIVHEAG